MSMRTPILAALAAILLLGGAASLCPGRAAAQPGPPPHDGPGSPEWEELMNKVAMLRNFKMIEALDLDEQTAARLAVYLKDREEERLDVLARKGEVHRRIKDWADAGGADDAEAEELLSSALELDAQERAMEHELVEGLDKVLTPSQQLKFVLVNREFDREVQDIIREHKKDRRREIQERRRGP